MILNNMIYLGGESIEDEFVIIENSIFTDEVAAKSSKQAAAKTITSSIVQYNKPVSSSPVQYNKPVLVPTVYSPLIHPIYKLPLRVYQYLVK